ncbi:MAG: cold shock domain-containing protein [Saprospiraceae bacterium]|nr:cold shock domain-containing protein [Saprospiraceae bacterium]MCB0623073.1 cold shock domain-containing protein [Saprospiraceae bacterium]MCB0676758.1 cold shock domain-containing protein [Saprospiraceae bacterium]MCB0683971.1 cold shock domain-containing protein [Saprospiraceae bacterium]
MWFKWIRFWRRPKVEKVRRGTVKFFNRRKGFGFIRPQKGGQDVFVHVSALKNEISRGDTVQFEVRESNKGLEAREVRIL